jgi:DNA primase
VVGRRVKLQKAGREWKGLSPFNAERTPSFFVNDQKQAWFDFSSGRNGDIFTFLIEVEGLSFGEAVEKLAAEAGVTLPKFTPEAEQREKRRASLHDVMALAVDYFRAELKAAEGRDARAYLTSRGLTPDVAERFGIGFAPNMRHGLRDFLAGKDVPLEMMIETGLLISGDDIPVPYDRSPLAGARCKKTRRRNISTRLKRPFFIRAARFITSTLPAKPRMRPARFMWWKAIWM